MGDDAGDRPVGVDPVHPFNLATGGIGQFHSLAISVAGVGEINPIPGVERQVVGLIEPLPLVAVDQDGEVAICLETRDPALDRLGDNQPPLPVEQQPIRPGILAKDGLPTLQVAAVDVAAATGQQAQLRVPGGAFAGPFLGEQLWFGPRGENWVGGAGSVREHKPQRDGGKQATHRAPRSDSGETGETPAGPCPSTVPPLVRSLAANLRQLQLGRVECGSLSARRVAAWSK